MNAIVLSVLALFALFAAPATQPAPVRIVLVGDSTVTEKEGWGRGFKELVSSDVVVTNLALGGRSSKSYRNEGHWAKVLESKGDYVLLQFGHNDSPGKGPERETDAGTEFRENMKRYVMGVREAGMKPVLVTSLTRRKFGADGKIKADSLDGYVATVKSLAVEMKVPLLDLNARSIEMCERLGEKKCEAFAQPPKEGKPDLTHLNAEGSRVFAELVADELARVVPELGAHLRK